MSKYIYFDPGYLYYPYMTKICITSNVPKRAQNSIKTVLSILVSFLRRSAFCKKSHLRNWFWWWSFFPKQQTMLFCKQTNKLYVNVVSCFHESFSYEHYNLSSFIANIITGSCNMKSSLCMYSNKSSMILSKKVIIIKEASIYSWV